MNKRTIFICFAFCFAAALVVSATINDADSLYAKYVRATNKSERLYLAREINNILREFQYTSLNDSVFSEKQTDEKLDKMTVSNMTAYAYQKSHYDDVLKYGEKGIALSRIVGDSVGVADNLGLMSSAYQVIGQIGKALDCLQQAIALQKSSGDEYGLSISYHNLGYIYFINGYNDVALINLNKALDIARKIGVKQHEATCLSSIGDVYNNQGLYDEAMKYVEQSLEIQRQVKSAYGMLVAYLQMAEIDIAKKDLATADFFLAKSFQLCDSVNNSEMEAYVMMTYGQLRMAQKRPDEAETYFNNALDAIREIGNVNVERIIYQNMYKLYKPININKSFAALEKYFEIENKYYSEGVQENITNFHYRVATEEKELRIALQESELKREKILRTAFACFALLLLIMLFVTNYYRSLIRRRNRELCEMNATKDKFFSIISHDLKNPSLAQQQTLKAIVDNFNLIDEKMLRSQCAMLLQSADAQVELLHNLLGWAQIQTGRMPFRPTYFELRHVIVEISELMAISFTSKKIRFESVISSESIVYGDRTMIATIIRNLVSNSIKFTPEGGTVSVDVVVRNKKSYSITVHDNGIGMNADTLRNLFRIDRRTSRLGTEGELGSGLGLIVCQEMAKRNGGTLVVESTEGIGTSFTFDVQ